MKLNIQLLTAAVLSIGGLVMLFCGIYISPWGQIHESLLVAFGEVMTFSGSLMGIDYHYKSRHNDQMVKSSNKSSNRKSSNRQSHNENSNTNPPEKRG